MNSMNTDIQWIELLLHTIEDEKPIAPEIMTGAKEATRRLKARYNRISEANNQLIAALGANEP